MIFETVTQSDIDLVKRPSDLHYPGSSLKQVVDNYDIKALDKIREKFKFIAEAINETFGKTYGPLNVQNSTRNPVGKNKKLRRIWCCVFKGNVKKQYSAQIMVGIDPIIGAVDIGFSFGMASSRTDEIVKLRLLEDGLKRLGEILHYTIGTDSSILGQLNDLLDLGFKCYVRGNLVSLLAWIENLLIDPTSSAITIKLPSEANGMVDDELMKYYIGACIPLISIFPYLTRSTSMGQTFVPRTRTPEERAKEAERKTIIGIEGEKIALDYEKKKLAKLKLVNKGYPQHVAAISDSYHYDILSLDEVGKIYIEVKTTARQLGDPLAEIAYMSAAEYYFFKNHPNTYRIYRVYDIFGNPTLIEVNTNDIAFETDGYRMKIQSRKSY